MRLNGDLADPELAADLLVQLAGNDQIHHLPLAVAECFITVTKGAYLGFCAKRDFTALDPKICGSQFAERISRSRDARTELSSSTTDTTGVAREIAVDFVR